MRSSFTLLTLFIALATAAPHTPTSEPDPALATNVTFGGLTFINKGLVGFGFIPSDARDRLGETIGGIGSAIALKRGTFQQKRDGSFSGVLFAQPDRGFNVDGTEDYHGRHHEFKFTLRPYYGAANLSFGAAQDTLQLEYRKSVVYKDIDGRTPTSGLDALAVRPAVPRFADPPMPIPSIEENHISLDAEGMVQNADGSFWVSDEYGPYIHLVDANGHRIHTLAPPAAALPLINGTLNFTASINPDSGRTPNQGFEGMTTSPDGRVLYALMQSALIQDGGAGNNNRFTRLFKWDVSFFAAQTHFPPRLVGEWVVPLPQSSKGKTFAQSEMHILSEEKGQFLVLARDGHGHGDTTFLSAYKSIDLVDISQATDIHGTEFDAPTGAVAPNGVLNSTITPALYQTFLSLIDPVQLARFGLRNGGTTADDTLIDAKWESIALAPVLDPAFPHDYFVFTMADNDFITENGFAAGMAYNAGDNVDTQALVFRATLPSIPRGSVEESIGI